MTNTSRGGAPKRDGNCSRNGILPGRRAVFTRGVAVLAVAACLALAACSSSQGVSGQTPARSAQSGPRITVDMVTHGQAFDPFWALVQKGAQAAGIVTTIPLGCRAAAWLMSEASACGSVVEGEW